jgi:hypothetical protein
MFVAHLLAAANSLDSNPDISQKYKMGDISKGLANTHKPNIQKKPAPPHIFPYSSASATPSLLPPEMIEY